MNLRGANGDDLTVLSTDQLWALVREYIFYLNKHNQVKYSTRYSIVSLDQLMLFSFTVIK